MLITRDRNFTKYIKLIRSTCITLLYERNQHFFEVRASIWYTSSYPYKPNWMVYNTRCTRGVRVVLPV